MVVNRKSSITNRSIWDTDRSALQTLHKVSSKAREQNFFQGGVTHAWVAYYEDRIESDRSCLNEWHAMDNLESKRPPSPDSIRTKPTEREETEKVIRTTLKEIMMSVDLDEVTSKYIRSRLEEDLDMDLGEYKSFIDQEMLTILGQMDAPTEIFEHVYLGSEWNASNYEELQRNGVGHILNVTREIDNFFPGTFNYYNVRVCDDEKTDLLKYWDDTFKYITSAKLNGSKVLVHCKMGISRSASVVIAYAMKAYNWDFQTAMHHVKEKRTCIKPNTSFLSQLETYQGILDAMKNKEKLQRSKSETNLKSPELSKIDKILPGSEPTPIVQARPNVIGLSGLDLRSLGTRPKSWSPDNLSEKDYDGEKSTLSLSLEELSQKSDKQVQQTRHVLMPCDNGESYSVSPNQIVHLQHHHEIPSVKDRVSELESSGTKQQKNWDPGENQRSSCNGTSDSCDSQSSDSRTVWTSSSTVVVKSAQRDPFSNQLDRVFDREEKKQSPETRECPSRQSSWSSYDSAVVLGSSQNDVGLSRHSSWGSGDTRALPSRNSSWGSYDLRPKGENSGGLFPYDKEDIPWHPGTVKRTRQMIEENNCKSNDAMTKSSSSETLFDCCLSEEKPAVEAINKQLIKTLVTVPSSAISPTIKIPVDDANSGGGNLSRLSVSAPESSSMDLVTNHSLSRSTSNVSNLSKDSSNPTTTGVGKVRSLKKEFEAKTNELNPESAGDNKKNSSVPSSPISVHQEKKDKVEDLKNVKNLLGIFEAQVTKRPKTTSKAFAPKNARYSCVEVSKWKSSEKTADRPPISPVVRNNTPQCLVASVIASATKKQQQFGKSHPLARLTIKPRHNNPLYNTM